MYTRVIYRNILTPIAEGRIENKQCPSCGKPKSDWNRRTDWTCCSTDCTEKFWKEHDKSISWQGQRSRALKRDNFTCKKCGIKHSQIYKKGEEVIEYELDNKLQVDHIIPVSIGGDSLDLDNLQTLCIECHIEKTKEDLKEIAKYRMIEKKQEKNQTLKIPC